MTIRNALRALIFITSRTEPLGDALDRSALRDLDVDIEDGLGGHAGYRRTANVVDAQGEIAQSLLERRPQLRKCLRPGIPVIVEDGGVGCTAVPLLGAGGQTAVTQNSYRLSRPVLTPIDST